MLLDYKERGVFEQRDIYFCSRESILSRVQRVPQRHYNQLKVELLS
jgi:hypothetical protein